MSLFPFLPARIRTQLLISICLISFAAVLLWTTRSQAGNSAGGVATRHSVAPGFTTEKGGIVPETATIIVNSLSDVANGSDGLCTLREAITAANNNVASGAVAGECTAGTNSGSDTINLAGVTGTINLTGVLPDITSDLSLIGPGSGQLTVRRDTGGDYRIFLTNHRIVAISGMTITNGKTPDGTPSSSQGGSGGQGGGIWQIGGAMTLTDVVITGNATGNGGTSGGSFSGGRGGEGGGISAWGSLTMTNCSVRNNVTGNGAVGYFGGSGGRGAGIYYLGSGSTLTIANSEVKQNAAGNGIAGTSGAASGDGGEGGGILAEAGQLNLTNVVIEGNHAGDGAPLYSSEGGHGGGMSIYSDVTATMTNCTVSNNNSGQGGNGVSAQGGLGGGIFNAGQLTIINSTLNGNFTKGPSSGGGASGGGIFNGNILTVFNSTITGNQTDADKGRGGGIYNNGATMRLTNCTITENQSTNPIYNFEPGGIASTGNMVTIRNSIVANNGSDSRPDVSGNFNSQGHNLIGRADSNSTGFTNGVNSDQVGTIAAPINPGLGPIANNGGLTQTHALLSNSPALDAGDNCVADVAHCGDSNIPQLATDQRGAGFVRLADGPDVDTTATVDIGAYETQPLLAQLPNSSTNEDTQLVISFDAGDTSTISSVTATSSNVTLVPNDSVHLSIGVVGLTCIVTINPATDQNGTTNIMITVNRTGGPESKTFMLTVNPVNDAPSFIKGADQTVNEDAGPQTVNNWATNISAGAADESGQTLTFQVTNNTNAALFSVAPAISATGTLTFTSAPDANGVATITVNLKDNGGTANGGVDTSASQTATITVNGVNDAPSFIKGPDQTFNEDTGPHFVAPWATNVSPGPANESSQTLTFQITNNTNPGLFSNGPAINSAGQLSFTSVSNANGSASITVVLKDNGGTSNGGVDTSSPQTFAIIVNPVNDPPSFTRGPNQTVNNNAGPQTVTNWATAISPGPADEASQTVTFQIFTNNNPSIFSVQPVISPTGTLTYTPNLTTGGTAIITINLKDNGGTANGGVDTSGNQQFTITVNPIGGFFAFSKGTFLTNESSGSLTLTVLRTGDTSRAATVDYATSEDNGLSCSTANGVATPKCDFTPAVGTLSFAAGDATKTLIVLIGQDSFVEGLETFTVTLSNPTSGAALWGPASTIVTIADDNTEPPTNAIDDVNDFVRMHYHDFLNREADQSGLDFWRGQITSCGSDSACTEVRRINVSAAFFLSIEFQQTGYLVERIYKAAYGDATGTSTIGGSHQLAVPTVRFTEFLRDTQRIGRGVVVLQPGWEQALENNKQAYAHEFVATTSFMTAFPSSMTPAQFVDKLNQNAGNVLSASERATAINLFGSATDTSSTTARAQAVRQVAENQVLYNAESNRAFVLAQYFGYLRRNPDDPQDTDYTGYEFWLTKLNQFNGDYVAAEMVKAFISSGEYRQRFGP